MLLALEQAQHTTAVDLDLPDFVVVGTSAIA
jgi:hypothetical protein